MDLCQMIKQGVAGIVAGLALTKTLDSICDYPQGLGTTIVGTDNVIVSLFVGIVNLTSGIYLVSGYKSAPFCTFAMDLLIDKL